MWDIADHFAGEAYVARAARQLGLSAVALDLSYLASSAMDINSNAGYASLVSAAKILEKHVLLRNLNFSVSKPLPQPRLSILCALQAKEDSLSSFGTCCSSWVRTAIGGPGTCGLG